MSSSPAASPTTKLRSSTRRATRHRSRISASCRNRTSRRSIDFRNQSAASAALFFCERKARPLRHQEHFPDILAVLNEVMRRRRFVEAEALRDSGLDHPLAPEVEELTRPFADATDLAPHVSEIDAEDALIGVHQRNRIELKPRRAREHGQHAKHAALLPAGRRGNAEHAQPPRRREDAIALLPRTRHRPHPG